MSKKMMQRMLKHEFESEFSSLELNYDSKRK